MKRHLVTYPLRMVLLLELLSAVHVILCREPAAWISHIVLEGRVVLHWNDAGYRPAFSPHFSMQHADRVQTSHVLAMTVGEVPDAQAGLCSLVFAPVNPLDMPVPWGMFLV